MRRVLLGIAVLLVAGGGSPGTAQELIPVGVAKIDVTPEFPIRLSGYGNRRTESEGIAQRLWAKALAFGADDAGPAILITVDNCGIPGWITEEVRGRLAKKLRIRPECVALCSSHTHTGPMVSGVLGLLFGMPIPAEHYQSIDRYTRDLVDRLEQVAVAALADRQLARLGWTVGAAGFAQNRRTAGGPVDHSLPLLRVVGADGKLRALLVNYACHCTTLGGDFNQVCGDWAGYAQETIERDHPGTIALVAIGCGADANPQPRTGLELARRHGAEIGAEVKRLLAGPLKPLSGPPVAKLARFDLPFDTLPTRQHWLARAQSPQQAIAYHATVQLERLDRGESIPTKLPYSVQTWTFGKEMGMAFLPGEVVVDYALRLKRELDGARLWINAYSNDVPCYIPSQRVLREGGYEAEGAMVYYDRPTRLQPVVEDLIVAKVKEQLGPAFAAGMTAAVRPGGGVASTSLPPRGGGSGRGGAVRRTTPPPLPSPIKGEGKEAPIKGEGREAPIKGEGKVAPIEGEGKEAPIKGEEKEAPIKGEEKEAPIKGEGKEAPIKGEEKEVSGKGEDEEASAVGEGKKWEGDEIPPPKSPQESLATIRTKTGLAVDLVAAEPLIVDPVAIDFGADGRLWVAEMRDYPSGIQGDFKPGGRISFLTDADGDGRYDKATRFLDNVAFPTGIMEWRNGVLIGAAPEVLYAEDTDGDGRADLRKVLFTGFYTENYQARVNGFAWGLDHWVHASCGLFGGKISTGDGRRTFDLGARDFRFRPDSLDLEPIAGTSQQGRIRDDWGNWFGNTNSELLLHYPMPDHYVRRNPHVAGPSPRVHVASDGNQLHPASRTLLRFNDPEAANRVTSACGPGLYRDDLLGRDVWGDAFICEPVHNLVTRRRLSPAGATFTGRRPADETQSEFFASTDNWCRPVQALTGPDGALWIVDMYRFVIEHPRWITAERLAKLDVRAGDDKGRIYRVYPKNAKLRPIVDLTRLPTVELAGRLDTPNGPMRDLVHRQLVQRAGVAAAGVLRRLARESQYPQVRLQALAALNGLEALESADLLPALGDRHAEVRRHAIRLSEQRLARDPELAAAVLGCADDAELVVRYQLSLTLGAWPDRRAGAALARLALRDAADTYVVAAVLSSAVPHLETMVTAILDGAHLASASPTLPPARILEDLWQLGLAQRNDRALAAIAGALALESPSPAAADWQRRTLGGILERIERRGGSLSKLATEAGPELRIALGRLERHFRQARETVDNGTTPAAALVASIALLGRGLDGREQDRLRLAGLLRPDRSAQVQLAAVLALGRFRDASTARLLLEGWRSHGPVVRNQVLDLVLRRPAWAAVLLEAVEAKHVAPADVDLARRQQLLDHPDAGLKERAARAFAVAVNPDRARILDDSRAALDLRGDPARGAKVFEKACAICHRFRGAGREVGPDLETLTDRSPVGLLIAILDPNRAVESKFLAYTAATVDGQVISGRIVEETGTSVTLLAAEGKRHILLRSELEALAASGKSLMPDGLEKELSPQDLADVLAYVGAAGPPRKTFTGNQPAIVAANENGTFYLWPVAAEIYGTTLAFDNGVLVDWKSLDDRAVWRAQVDRPGTYEVWLDWLCPDGSGGNRFAIEVGEQRSVALEAKVPDSLSQYNVFRQVKVGSVALPAGVQRIGLRAAGDLDSTLLHLRSLRLLPEPGPTSKQ